MVRGKITCDFNEIKDVLMTDVVSRHGCLGSSNFRAILNGPLISIFDYRNQNRQSRTDKGYSLKAIEDIAPNTTIAHFVGEHVPSSTVSEKKQSILLCNNTSMLRPKNNLFKGIHVAWCANDARFEKKEREAKNNAKISGYGHIRNGKPTAVSLVSTKKIWANTEIFCNYGRTYKVAQKANQLRESSVNKALDTLRVHDRRKIKKKQREKKGLVPLKKGRCKKWCKNKKIDE